MRFFNDFKMVLIRLFVKYTTKLSTMCPEKTTYLAVQVQCAVNTFPVTLDENVFTAYSGRFFGSDKENNGMTLQRIAQWEHSLIIGLYFTE